MHQECGNGTTFSYELGVVPFFFAFPFGGSMTVRLSRRVKVSLVVTVSNTPAKQYMRAHSGRREIASIFFTCQLTLFILKKTSKIRNKTELYLYYTFFIKKIHE